MKEYEILDISGDVGLVIYGKCLQDIFINAAVGLFSLITDTSTIENKEERKFKLSSEDLEELLIDWLNELIFLFDTYDFVGKSFHINFIDKTLEAVVMGGFFNAERNERRLLIKAATYHDLYLKRLASGYKAMVMLDI